MGEPGWFKFPVQDAWTQAFRYSDRRQETGDIVEEGRCLMGGRYSSLKVVSVGGLPLNNPLQIMYVGTCISKEAH